MLCSSLDTLVERKGLIFQFGGLFRKPGTKKEVGPCLFRTGLFGIGSRLRPLFSVDDSFCLGLLSRSDLNLRTTHCLLEPRDSGP